MKGMKLTKKNLKVFGKEFEKEPLFKKVCLNLSECEYKNLRVLCALRGKNSYTFYVIKYL